MTGQPFAVSSTINQSSAGPITADGMSAGSITSQPFGSSITASQPVDSIASGQPAIIAGTISANSIIVTQMPPANITVDQNVNVDVLPVSHNDANVSKGNTIVTGTNSLPRKEGMKLPAKSQMK